MLRKPALLTIALIFASVSIGQAAAWHFDTAHSNISFKVKHLMVTNVNGSFGEYDGVVKYDPDNPTAAEISVSIKTNSVNTNNDKRDDHLRSADFFDVATYPEMTFKSKQVAKTADGLIITGDLTLHGITKEVVLNVEEIVGPVPGMMGAAIGATATTKIDRRDFGLVWSKTLETGALVVDNIVKIILEVELIKQ
ncbi:YceI family protein [bacterium]|nr:YceI family protein [bacterium]MBU1881926.1 YceI family protein [bacterium]